MLDPNAQARLANIRKEVEARREARRAFAERRKAGLHMRYYLKRKRIEQARAQ